MEDYVIKITSHDIQEYQDYFKRINGKMYSNIIVNSNISVKYFNKIKEICEPKGIRVTANDYLSKDVNFLLIKKYDK